MVLLKKLFYFSLLSGIIFAGLFKACYYGGKRIFSSKGNEDLINLILKFFILFFGKKPGTPFVNSCRISIFNKWSLK